MIKFIIVTASLMHSDFKALLSEDRYLWNWQKRYLNYNIFYLYYSNQR